MNSDFATIIGSVGVTLLLLAFFLNIIKVLRAESYPYILLNIIGGALAAYSSYLIEFLPFVILESTWAAVALVALFRKLIGKSAAASPAH
jgi:nucleoside recognition membrane protein YjiH